ncbi:E3 ubiquitin-protein ligase Topor [Vigna unguiculata]|uniref:E3 ubiquitin-protein ligase Topor n=1 Tax=Vigna unguiculata TaxID=3917 RepID=A0A4D6MBW8_VIGUN|nr:E3 ubiquitin-protein ligase Topor [Vigna unguiculata]QCE03322.1 E3 ubiquitin-protein ligase Topor [Vigna unguiculata]
MVQRGAWKQKGDTAVGYSFFCTQYSVESTIWKVRDLKHSALAVRIVQYLPRHISCSYDLTDSLEKGTEHEDEYMISEKELLVNKFISIPKDMGTFNCGAFVAGIVRGVLDGAGFPAVVTAHFVPMEGQQRPRTTILIKFAEEVLQREARLG